MVEISCHLLGISATILRVLQATIFSAGSRIQNGSRLAPISSFNGLESSFHPLPIAHSEHSPVPSTTAFATALQSLLLKIYLRGVGHSNTLHGMPGTMTLATSVVHIQFIPWSHFLKVSKPL